MRLAQVVKRSTPFHRITELDSLFTKLDPATVNVRPPLPAKTFVGDIEASVGAGNRQVPIHWTEML